MSGGLPDWNDLRDLLLIHDAGSLSEAARRAGVSQSTMSRRLAAIEAGGRRVFARDAAGRLAPTDRGAVLLDAARRMRAAIAAAAAALDGPEPPLRIAACEVTSRLFLADALPAWARAGDAPADLAVHDDLFALRPADYDVLVAPLDGLPPGGVGVELGRIGWGLFAAPAYLARHPVAAGAGTLAGHRVIRASGSLARIGVYRWLEAMGGTAALLSSSPLAQREACIRGQGIALLPLGLAEGEPGLVRIDGPAVEDTPVWLLADGRDASHPRIAAFLRWARRHFGRRGPAAATRLRADASEIPSISAT